MAPALADAASVRRDPVRAAHRLRLAAPGARLPTPGLSCDEPASTSSESALTAVLPANLHDSHGGIALLQASRGLWPFLAHCFAERAYQGKRVGSATAISVEIIQPKEDQKGFAVQPTQQDLWQCLQL